MNISSINIYYYYVLIIVLIINTTNICNKYIVYLVVTNICTILVKKSYIGTIFFSVHT